MRKQQGRVNFTGLIMILLVVYGGYAAVKLISASLSETQIRKEVIDTLGTMRGADFSAEEGTKAVREILMKNGIVFDEESGNEANVRLDRQHGNLTFSYKYNVEVDLLFFKKKKTVNLTEEMKSYD
ncbi:MAG: hypothetical protein NT166_27065 [Candidatus Aminicenantes bacterium]|nr:hypothetical protein [Candidatus Aminicenantes bacterium]